MGPLAWILPAGQSERQSKETEILEIYLFPVLPHSVWVDVEASVLLVYTRSHPQVSHFEAIGKRAVEHRGVSTGSHTTGAFLGVGVGVHSITSTSFPFEAIGK